MARSRPVFRGGNPLGVRLRSARFARLHSAAPQGGWAEEDKAIYRKKFTPPPYRFALMRPADWDKIVVQKNGDLFKPVEGDEDIWQHIYYTLETKKPHLSLSGLARSVPGYVYLILSAESRLYKIGFTRNPNCEKRGAELQTGSAEKLTIVAFFRAASPRTERALHDQFCDKRIRGEWFSLTEADVADIKSEEWRRQNNIF